MKTINNRLLTSVAACLAVPAFAQTNDPQTTKGSSQPSGNRQQVTRTLEEVVVTAQKRQEALQDVPISISVLSGKVLDQSNESVLDELNRVPGVAALDAPLGGTLLTVRGVASTNTNFAGTTPIGYYLDSVPFGFIRSALLPDSNAYDLARIEVLRGPQGTLYGVNAQNGVVRVLTADANPDGFELKLRTSGSSTEDGGENYRGDMAVNVPLVSGKLAARAVVGYEKLAGWIDTLNRQDVNDSEVRNLRLKINGQPTERLSVGAMAWHTETEAGGRAISRDDRTTILTMPEDISEEYDVYAFNLGYEFDRFSVTSATSHIDYASDTVVDFASGGSVPLTSAFTSEVVAEEISINSTGDGLWRWSLGGMYRDVEDLVHQRVPIFANPNGIKYNDYSESFALFGEVTRTLLDGRFEVTGGLRYFEDDVRNKQRSNPSSTTATLITSSGKFHAVSPRVVLTWHPGDDWTVYTSYSEGFRSGFPQSPTVIALAPGFPDVDSDNLTNYELGMKSSLADGAISLEAAAFFIDWQDVQQSITVPTGITNIAAVINGKSASGLGAELALGIHPTDGLTLGLSYSWNDLAFDAVVISRGVAIARDGDRLSNSPEQTAGASIDYAFPFGSGYESRFSASANYLSKRLFRGLAGTAAALDEGDSSLVSRLSFSVSAPGGWTAMLFVDNLNDEDGATPFQATASPLGENRLRPRTIGLSFEYKL